MYRHGPASLEGPISLPRSCWSDESGGVLTLDPVDEIRHELVARVRREIAAGTYDTPEKLEIALDRLLNELDA